MRRENTTTSLIHTRRERAREARQPVHRHDGKWAEYFASCESNLWNLCVFMVRIILLVVISCGNSWSSKLVRFTSVAMRLLRCRTLPIHLSSSLCLRFFRAAFSFAIFNSICRDCNQDMFWPEYTQIKSLLNLSIANQHGQGKGVQEIRSYRTSCSKSSTDCAQFEVDFLRKQRKCLVLGVI